MYKNVVGVANHAQERVEEWYGLIEGKPVDLKKILQVIRCGGYLSQRVTPVPNRYTFTVEYKNIVVRVVASKESGKWSIVTALPPEFRGKTYRDANEKRRRQEYKQARRIEQDDDEDNYSSAVTVAVEETPVLLRQ